MNEYDDETHGHEDVEDFDAFWAEYDRGRKRPSLRLFGQVVELPPALPLQFELEAKRLARSKRDRDVSKLVAILFGADVLEKWAEAGMDSDQFQLLLAWAPRRIAGQKVTLTEVAAELAAAEAKKQKGKKESDPS